MHVEFDLFIFQITCVEEIKQHVAEAEARIEIGRLLLMNFTDSNKYKLLIIILSRLRWFRYVEGKDDSDWVKRGIAWEVDGIRQRGCPKKTWWDCINMESLGLSQKYVQVMSKWRRRIKGATG